MASEASSQDYLMMMVTINSGFPLVHYNILRTYRYIEDCYMYCNKINLISSHNATFYCVYISITH